MACCALLDRDEQRKRTTFWQSHDCENISVFDHNNKPHRESRDKVQLKRESTLCWTFHQTEIEFEAQQDRDSFRDDISVLYPSCLCLSII